MAQNAPAIKVNCPDRSGVISLDMNDTGHVRYVCQIGHAYSVEKPFVAKEEQVENGFWGLIGLLEHLEEVDRHLLNEAGGGSALPKRSSLRATRHGVLLTGGGDDGVRDLINIKVAAGISIIQNQDEAKASSMPMNALLYDHVDLVLSLHDIPSAVAALVQGESVHRFPKLRRSSSLPASEPSGTIQ